MKKKNNQQGNVLILTTIFFVVISLSVSLGLVVPAIRTHKIAEHTLHSKRSYQIAESGVEDVVYRLKTGRDVLSSQTLVLGNSQTTTLISDISTSQKEIISEGVSSNRNRKIKVIISHGEGSSFNYGIQSGKGGITMGNNSLVRGSIYSNGPVIGDGAVTGSVTSGNSASLTTNQQNGSGVPPYNIIFGDSNTTQDFAQSFRVTENEQLNKISLYIRKVSSPSNLSVALVEDNNGNPTGTTLATATLSSSLVSTQYGWVDVFFSTNPNLYSGTTYWFILDGGSSGSQYYIVGANTEYLNGSSKIGRLGFSWNAPNPANADAYFGIYLGGVTGLIDGIDVGQGGTSPANAYAYTVINSTITGVNYCQAGSGNNKPCTTSQPVPSSITMPISEQNIEDWKDAAEDGGTYNGNLTINDDVEILGPLKITGNLTIDNNADVTIAGTVWVQGNLVVDNNADVRLLSSYQEASGVIVVDGTATISNNALFHGSGQSGAYIMVLSISYSPSAINIENNVGAVILYAANGTVNVSNNASAISINGFKINISPNAVINYETGLANVNFTNGPGGTWNIRSMKEIE